MIGGNSTGRKTDKFHAFGLTPQAATLERDGAHILAIVEREVFSAYVVNPRGPVFMTLIEKTFGKDVTTRTWETVRKCASA